MKTREALFQKWWIRPFAHLLGHPSLWHLNRRSLPRGVALGLFVGFLIPFGQFALAALLAVPFRANVPTAASATLVTNPLTFAPIYFAAFKVGGMLPIAAFGSGAADADWLSAFLHASGATAVGLLIFAVVFATLGYAISALFWRFRLAKRWSRRPAAAERLTQTI
ncbi:DUF2062 domain-containing protein [Novosphingobium sp. M1R2S20]|uniref:DUF2062 domain-containing protein n=1 Tax=Novosphingobium rhizovicinum TaxID=3228928 RepID=A0ABV3RAB1_9SPHN